MIHLQKLDLYKIELSTGHIYLQEAENVFKALDSLKFKEVIPSFKMATFKAISVLKGKSEINIIDVVQP